MNARTRASSSTGLADASGHAAQPMYPDMTATLNPGVLPLADRAMLERVLHVLSIHTPRERPNWTSMLTHAMQAHPVVFARDGFARRYRDLAADPDWFADSLVANACLEGYGARQILAFADRLTDDAQAQLVRKHALDESRHATVFIRMLEAVFPGLLASQESSIREQVRNMQPMLTEDTARSARQARAEGIGCAEPLGPLDAVSDLIQVHITEIRALVLQDLVREALILHAPAGQLPMLLRMSDHLIADEARHIAYCADIIESAARESADTAVRLHDAMATHLNTFNQLTLEELDREAIEI